MFQVSFIHTVVGTVVLISFLLTGVTMLIMFPELYAGRQEIRMMYRATHIYLLMSSLINLMAGIYTRSSQDTSFIRIRLFASWCLIVAPAFILVAFFTEPATYAIDRPYSFWGIVLLLAGVVLHSLVTLPWLSRKK